MTKLALVADRVVEVGWLAAVAVVPLYMGIFSNRVFEPDKIVMLRCLVLVMGAAFVIGWLERLGEGLSEDAGEDRPSLMARLWQSVRSDPILAATCALVAVTALSTAISIVPRTSLWGSYVRLQGLYSLLSFVAVFLMMRQRLRSRAQLDRLVLVVIITAIPISLYGLLQHLQLDPLPWSGDTTFRVTSTMGNAIFLAAYLGMVAPLTAAKLAGAVQQWRVLPLASSGRDQEDGPGGVIKYAGVVALQVAFMTLYIISAGISVGMFWAMLPAIVVFVSLIAILPDQRPTRWWIGGEIAGLSLALVIQLAAIFFTQSRGPWLGVGAGLVVLAVLASVVVGSRRLAAGAAIVSGALIVALLIFNLPNSPLAPLRSLPYVGRLGSLMESSTGTGRVRILIWQGVGELVTTLPNVGLTEDRWHALRPLLGYGPESMYVAYNKVYQPELAHLEARTASPDRSHNDLMDYVVTTGWLGLLSYLALFAAALAVGWRWLRRTSDLHVRIVVAGLMSALVSHFVESQFGIVIASSRTLFWVYLGVIASVPALLREVSAVARPEPLPSTAGAAPVAESQLAFAVAGERGSVKAGRRDRGRRGRGGGREPRQRAPTDEADAERDARGRARSLNVVGLWALAAYMMATMLGIVALGRGLQVDNPQPALGLAVVWTVIGLAVMARSLDWRQAALFFRRRWLWAYVLLAAAVGAGCLLNVNVVAADVYYKRAMGWDAQAEALVRGGNTGDAVRARLEAIGAYRHALALSPDEDYYHLFLGRSLIELAKLANAGQESGLGDQSMQAVLAMPLQDLTKLSQTDLLQLSRTVLDEAYRLNPLNTDHSANLARLYRTWAELTGDVSKLNVASNYYRQATTLSPRSAQLYCEWAQVDLMRSDVAGAWQRLRAAEALDAEFPTTFILLGDAYLVAGRFDEAIQAHIRALRLDASALSDSRLDWRLQLYADHGKGDQLAEAYRLAVSDHSEDGLAHGAYGSVLFKLGKLEEAVVEFETYARLSPRDWMAHRNLALVYRELGRTSDALAAAERALKLAPPNQVPGVQDLVQSLQKGGG